ncbi:hypothetical protein M6B38_318915 [Iris pallida]|uniref:NADH dehydrogenase subunit 4L n=1 Tax=Iris pallida TaxID=29817 RepID=A0AAX6HDA6_IRIPA|nr:hypothetical protein M6B38_318915 [Iris pallida]
MLAGIVRTYSRIMVVFLGCGNLRFSLPSMRQCKILNTMILEVCTIVEDSVIIVALLTGMTEILSIIILDRRIRLSNCMKFSVVTCFKF